jgi:hypothetical protein
MNVQWVLIRSWHAVKGYSVDENRTRTVCGRNAYSAAMEALPGGKSCETCLRIVARQADQ